MTESPDPKSEPQQEQTASSASPGCGFTRLTEMFEPPAGAGQHFRQARIEFLKGIRGLVDYQIDRLSHGPHKGTRITVD